MNKNVFVRTRHLDDARSERTHAIFLHATDEFTGDKTPARTFGEQSALVLWRERPHNIFRQFVYKSPVLISAFELCLLVTAV